MYVLAFVTQIHCPRLFTKEALKIYFSTSLIFDWWSKHNDVSTLQSIAHDHCAERWHLAADYSDASATSTRNIVGYLSFLLGWFISPTATLLKNEIMSNSGLMRVINTLNTLYRHTNIVVSSAYYTVLHYYSTTKDALLRVKYENRLHFLKYDNAHWTLRNNEIHNDAHAALLYVV